MCVVACRISLGPISGTSPPSHAPRARKRPSPGRDSRRCLPTARRSRLPSLLQKYRRTSTRQQVAVWVTLHHRRNLVVFVCWPNLCCCSPAPVHPPTPTPTPAPKKGKGLERRHLAANALQHHPTSRRITLNHPTSRRIHFAWVPYKLHGYHLCEVPCKMYGTHAKCIQRIHLYHCRSLISPFTEYVKAMETSRVQTAPQWSPSPRLSSLPYFNSPRLLTERLTGLFVPPFCAPRLFSARQSPSFLHLSSAQAASNVPFIGRTLNWRYRRYRHRMHGWCCSHCVRCLLLLAQTHP